MLTTLGDAVVASATGFSAGRAPRGVGSVGDVAPPARRAPVPIPVVGMPASAPGSSRPAFGASRPGTVVGAGLPGAGPSGRDRTWVGASGDDRATRGLASRAGATTTATRVDDRCVSPFASVARSPISLLPAGRGGGVRVKCPPASACARATGWPSTSTSTDAFGAARPAITASPFGSTRTTSNPGAADADGREGGRLAGGPGSSRVRADWVVLSSAWLGVRAVPVSDGGRAASG